LLKTITANIPETGLIESKCSENETIGKIDVIKQRLQPIIVPKWCIVSLSDNNATTTRIGAIAVK
jgi:hypothetical protein